MIMPHVAVCRQVLHVRYGMVVLYSVTAVLHVSSVLCPKNAAGGC